MENITTSDLRRAQFIVPQSGGNLEALDPETGEVIAAIGYQGGIHNIRMIAQYFPEGTVYRATGGVLALRDAKRGIVLRDPRPKESGANPDYQPKRMTDTEAMLFGMVSKLQSKVTSQEKRAKTAAQVAERNARRAEEKLAEDAAEEPVLIEEPEPEDGAKNPKAAAE